MRQMLPVVESSVKTPGTDPLSLNTPDFGGRGGAAPALGHGATSRASSVERLQPAQQRALRQLVYSMLGLLTLTGLVLVLGAYEAMPKFQVILGLAFLGVTADALILRLSLRSLPTAPQSLYTSIVSYTVIDLLMLLGIVLWASQMGRASGWNFPAGVGPHIPTALAVAAVWVAGLSRARAAIWVTAIGSTLFHLLAHLLVRDWALSWREMLHPQTAALYFAQWHLLYDFMIVGGSAVIAAHLLCRAPAPSTAT